MIFYIFFFLPSFLCLPFFVVFIMFLHFHSIFLWFSPYKIWLKLSHKTSYSVKLANIRIDQENFPIFNIFLFSIQLFNVINLFMLTLHTRLQSSVDAGSTNRVVVYSAKLLIWVNTSQLIASSKRFIWACGNKQNQFWLVIAN